MYIAIHKKRLYPAHNIFINNNFAGDRDIKSLKVHCVNTTAGCKWTGELGSLRQHLNNCRFVLVPCPNKCQPEPDFRVLRKDLGKHLKTACQKRKYRCPHCKKIGEFQERTTTHLDKCPKVKVFCPNNDCCERVARSDLDIHRQDCPFERVPCKYARLGCDSRLSRGDMVEHENDTERHLQMAIDTVNEVQSKMTQLESTAFKLTKFEQHKASGDKVRSPPFYATPEGYQFCIKVSVNGICDDKGTYISLFACPIRGPYDDHLTWPFTGVVTVELLNQLEDDNHFSSRIKFPNSLDSDTARYQGWGYGKYIPHTSLAFNAEKKCQYLKDDCLCFRVKAESSSNSKPWLKVSGWF